MKQKILAMALAGGLCIANTGICSSSSVSALTVISDIESISIEKSNISVGETVPITIKWNYGVNQAVMFRSADSSIAEVDQNGNVTGIAAGSTTITVSPNNYGAEKTIDITVESNEASELPEWVPQSFAQAMKFDNLYGKIHVADGLICCVRQRPSDRFTYETEISGTAETELISQAVYELEIPQKPDKSDTEAYEEYLRQLEELGIPEIYADSDFFAFNCSQYEVLVYRTLSAGSIILDLIRYENADNKESQRFEFNVSEDGQIEETFSWLPDSITEFWDFNENNEEVSVHNGYIVYCDTVCYDGGFTLTENHTGSADLEKIMDFEVSEASVMPAEPGSGGYTVKVYKPLSAGNIKMNFTQAREWEPDGPGTKEIIKYYEIGADFSIKEIAESEFTEQLEGDFNLDGKFDIADVLALRQWLLESYNSAYCEKNADINGDDEVDVFDFCLIKHKLLNS